MRVYLRYFGVVVDQGYRCDAADCSALFLQPLNGNTRRYCSRRCEQLTWDRRWRQSKRAAA